MADSRWVLTAAPERAYILTSTLEGETRRFDVRMVQLGDYKFLDFFPLKEESDDGLTCGAKNDFWTMHFVPAHLFARVRPEKDLVMVSLLDGSALSQAVSSGSVRIAHSRGPGDRIVLSAPTKQLQEFVLQIAGSDELFDEPERFERVKVE